MTSVAAPPVESNLFDGWNWWVAARSRRLSQFRICAAINTSSSAARILDLIEFFDATRNEMRSFTVAVVKVDT